MTGWFDTLFARLLLLQATVAVLVAVLFGLLSVRVQSQLQARAVAPLWSAALAPVLAGGQALPGEREVSTRLRLLPGPPPRDASEYPWMLRFVALQVELRAVGVPVQAVRISGHGADTITWLALEQAGKRRWVGVQSEFEGRYLGTRALIGFGTVLVFSVASTLWLSRRLLRPVVDLRQAMQRFAAGGQLPEPAAPGAPVELRELSQQFADLARQRLALDAQRRTMLAAISHDLRSPLGRIRLAAALLPDADGVAVRREVIERNVAVADQLLGSFIDLGRADDAPFAGQVDLEALVATLAAGDPDVRLLHLPGRPLWLQPANGLALERALRNLLDNARVHGAPPIELSLHQSGTWAVVQVRDHGPGIPADARDAALQPFVRGDLSRHVPGTGLGLAIVDRTVARHGGSLTLGDAAPGLRVELRLPLTVVADAA